RGRRGARHAAADGVAPVDAPLRRVRQEREASGPPMTIVLLGPPGSGKGTHGKKLSECLGVPTVSTGDILRQAIQEGTALGKSAEEYVKPGRLVTDAIVLGLGEAGETAPLVSYYEREGVLRNVDASGPAADVYAAIQRAIGKAA